MTGRIRDLADLLVPVRPETFLERSWENEPLHLPRAQSGFYDSLLTDRDVEAAISSGGLRYPAIQLAKDGVFLPPEVFTRNIRSGDDIFTGIPNLDRVRAEYESGATISLPGFHRAWMPLGRLAAAIEDDFDHAVHANVYVTPANASGFTPHYDTHEVFVLQIAGHKRWRIHKPPLPLPHRSQPFDSHTALSSPAFLDVDLAPGDLLYLPRGFVHSTATSQSFSLHVTLGVTVYTWVEVLADWVQSSRNGLRFRRALPAGFAGREEVRRSLAEELPGIVAELQATSDFGSLLDGFAQRILSARTGARGEFHADVTVIGIWTRLKTPERGEYAIAEEGGKTVLKFHGKTLFLEKNIRSALEEICRRPAFSALEVSRPLGERATLALIRALHREGFLSVIPPAKDRTSSGPAAQE